MKTKIIDEIIRVEGGYVDDPSDSGGETNFGITVGIARMYGYTGAMINMPRELAVNIYTESYWGAVCADQMLPLSESITREVVDTCVNMGANRASLFLQRSLNVLNGNGALFSDIAVDGNIGPATLSALESYLVSRGEGALLKALNCLQGAFYIQLAERREKDEKFIYGWLKNRVIL